MNTQRARTIEDRLQPTERPAPPAGLLERIQEEIPETLPAAGRVTGRPRPGGRRGLSPGWLVAASLAVAAVGGTLGFRALQQRTRPPDPVERADVASVPPAGARQGTSSEDAQAPVRAGREGEEPSSPTAMSVPEPGPSASPDSTHSDTSATASATDSPVTTLPHERAARLLDSLAMAAPEEGAPVGDMPAPEYLASLYEAGRAAVSPRREEERRRLLQLDPRVLGPLDGGAGPSTGGSVEPNDAPYGDMLFRHYGVNPFLDTEDDALSTFGLDVDTGSYGLVRGYLEEGHLPPPDAVRVEEMVNYFDYGDEGPRREDFTMTAEGAPSPFTEGDRYRLLRFHLAARAIEPEERKAADLVFVVDVSGSMEREDRLGLVQRALGLLLDQLGRADRVGLVVYADEARVLLEPTGDLERIRRAVEDLVPGGSTNAEDGLRLAYGLAAEHRRPGVLRRLILCSDGVANEGHTGPDSILARVRREADEGVELSTVGFGMGNYNDVLMEQLADRGDGRYAYVDDLAEARRVFVENLTGTLQTVAADARAQVEFNPEAVTRYRLLGYENRDIADERFRDDSVDAGEIGAGHRVTALYEVKLAEHARPGLRLAELRLRYRVPESGKVVEVSRAMDVGDLAPTWEDASRGLRLASVVAELAEILRDSYWAKDGDLDDVLRRAQVVSAEFAGDARVADFASLAARAAEIARARPDTRR